MNRALLAILVTNHFGVLTKVTGLFSRRGYNIKALSVGETDDSAISRITILTEGDELKLQQIYHQVSKLEDVKEASILPEGSYLEKELTLIKVNPQKRLENFLSVIAAYKAKAFEFEPSFYLVEFCDSMENVTRLIEELKGFNIIELSRTGPTALQL